MIVLPARSEISNRGKISDNKGQDSAPMDFPSPKGGLFTNYSIADDQAGVASVLKNFYPTTFGATIRGGSKKAALLNGLGDIQSSFLYKSSGDEKLFMATESAIYNVSALTAPPTTTSSSVSGLTSGDWTTIQHTTTGGSYLICVNGSDARRIFDGSSWATTPSITFSDSTTTADLNYVFLFKNREFYLKNDSLDAYYLPSSSIGGAASVFPLGGVMRRGGRLVMGFSWSLDSGDGLGDLCAFVSSEGEVAVYAGDDPTSVASFSLHGVYQLGKPLGKNAWIRAGGDVMIATTDGLVPLSQCLQKDRQALSLVSVSRPIEDDWRLAASLSPDGWTITQWPERHLAFVCFPDTAALGNVVFVVNVLTGAWSTVHSWRAKCFANYNAGLYFGSTGGYVWQADATGADDGAPFTAYYLSQFRPVGGFGSRKSATLAHMAVRANKKPAVKLFARANADTSLPNMSSVSTGLETASEWDVGLWDAAVWDGASVKNTYFYRQNVRACGETLAFGCAITSSGAIPLSVDIDIGTLQIGSGEQSA